MQMRMQRKILSPGVKDCNHTSVSTEMFFIVRKTFHHTPCRIEEQFVDLRRFKKTQLVECFGQCEDHMKISCWKQLRFSCLDPTLALYLLALGTMSIAARVVTDARMATICA